MPVRVGIYTRISEDDGERLGVERQEKDCRALAKSKGLEIAEKPYEDNNLSAFKRNVKRPAFERLLKDLESGVIDGVIVYDLDRFARQPRDLERLIDIYETRKGLTFATVQAGYDLSTADGITAARLLITFANKASMDTARRVKRVRRDEAEQGKPATSRHRSFGYDRTGMKKVASEAKVVRECVRRVLKGQTLGSIVADLNRRGITTSTGGEWDPSALRYVLTNKRITALREHDGVDYEGKWPAIVDRETWVQLVTVLNSPSRRTQTDTARKHLLPGFIYCGGPSCNGEVLMKSAHRSNNGGNPSRSYACNECQKVSISMKIADEHVRDHVLSMLAIQDPDVEPDSSVVELVKRIDELTEQLAEVDNAYFVDKAIDKARHSRLASEIEGRLADARRALVEASVGGTLEDVPIGDPDALSAAWKKGDLEWKRTLIATVVDKVVVSPATTTGRGSKAADRLTITNNWRDFGEGGIARRERKGRRKSK